MVAVYQAVEILVVTLLQPSTEVRNDGGSKRFKADVIAYSKDQYAAEFEELSKTCPHDVPGFQLTQGAYVNLPLLRRKKRHCCAKTTVVHLRNFEASRLFRMAVIGDSWISES